MLCPSGQSAEILPKLWWWAQAMPRKEKNKTIYIIFLRAKFVVAANGKSTNINCFAAK